MNLLRRLWRSLAAWRWERKHGPITGTHEPSEATKRGGYTLADVEELRWPGGGGKGGSAGFWPSHSFTLPGPTMTICTPEETIDDPFGATMPSPKSLREAANILETAPYRRMKTAAWLRYVAEQVAVLDQDDAAAVLDDPTILPGRCYDVGPAGYTCGEPMPHPTVHIAYLDETLSPTGRVIADQWVSADLPWLAEQQKRGVCAAINKGRRYICSLDLGHPGAHVARTDGEPLDSPAAEVVDTWTD